MAARRPKGTGKVRRLPSGRWQARFREHPAPCTFDTKMDAQAWLAGQVRSVSAGVWAAPSQAAPSTTLAVYAEGWLAGRDLRPRTRALYRGLLDRHILPGLGALPLDALTPFVVRRWHEQTAVGPDGQEPCVLAAARDPGDRCLR